MLYLAQVQKDQGLDTASLQLLACQPSETTWTLLPETEPLPSENIAPLTEGQLVLVELTDYQEIIKITDAKEWVLQFIKDYLSLGITPEFLQEEYQRAEQWRQDLTLQSQEVARGKLEVEARHAQLQIIEEKLNNEKMQLEEEKRKWAEKD